MIKIETGNPLKLSSETWFPQALNHKKQQRFKNSRFISLTLSMQWLLVLLGRFCNSVWHNILKIVNPSRVTPNFIFSLYPSFLLFFHPFSLAGDRSRAESNIRQVGIFAKNTSKRSSQRKECHQCQQTLQVLEHRPASHERRDGWRNQVHVPLRQRQGRPGKERTVWCPLHQDCSRYKTCESLKSSHKVQIGWVHKEAVSRSRASRLLPFRSSPFITSCPFT